MDAVEAGELIALGIVLVVIVPLGWLVGRRRWLAGLGGTFEAAVRAEGQAAFMLGVARYSGEYLEWFRSFSWTLTPRHRFRQSRWEIVETREPDASEAPGLVGLESVVVLRSRDAEPAVEMAISPASAMGLRSWLESAPAGRGTYVQLSPE